MTGDDEDAPAGAGDDSAGDDSAGDDSAGADSTGDGTVGGGRDVGDDREQVGTRALKLLQGYVWHPRDMEVDLADHLPRALEGDVHVLWDPLPAAPFTFFDDGTFAATQQVYQLTVLRFVPEGEDPGALLPWLAERLQTALESTPEGVGWQIMEDLRDLG